MAKSSLHEIKVALKKNILAIKKEIAIEALNHTKEKFKEGNGQWEGEKWKEPKRKEGPFKRQKRYKGKLGYKTGFTPRDAKRATLIGKGRKKLGNSFRKQIKGNTVRIYSKVVYAKRHNEGLDGMPKRQFIGDEKALIEKLDKIIKSKWEDSF